MSVRYGLRSSRVVCVDEWDCVLVQPAKVIIEDCHILAVIPEEGRSASAEEEELLRSCIVEDLGDAVIMPGIIDIYADLCVSERGSWEGAESGTKAAVAGGVTTVIDLPTRYALGPLPVTPEEVHAKAQLIQQSKLYCDVGMWGVAGVQSVKHIDDILSNGCWGFVAYMGFVSASIPSLSPSQFMNFVAELQYRSECLADEIPLLVSGTRMDFSQALRSSPCRNKTPEERLALKGPLNLQLSQGRASRASSANVSPASGAPVDPFPFDDVSQSPSRQISTIERVGSNDGGAVPYPGQVRQGEVELLDGGGDEDDLLSPMAIRSHGLSPKLNLCLDSKHVTAAKQRESEAGLPPLVPVINNGMNGSEAQFHQAVVHGLSRLQLRSRDHQTSESDNGTTPTTNERNNSIFSCPEEIGEIYVDDEVDTEIAEEEEEDAEEEMRPSTNRVWAEHVDRYRHGNRLSLSVPERVLSTDRGELQSPIVIELGDLEEEEEDWRILQQLPEGESQSVLKTLPKELIGRLHDAELQSYKFRPGGQQQQGAAAPRLQAPSVRHPPTVQPLEIKKCTSAASSPRRQSAPITAVRPATGSRINHHRPSYDHGSRVNSASGHRVKKYSTLSAVDTLERLTMMSREQEISEQWQRAVGHHADTLSGPSLTSDGVLRPGLFRTSSRPPPIVTVKLNDERLTSQVICREYLIYLDGFSSLLEMQGVSIMLTYPHTQQSADPELKTRAVSAISAASSREMFGPDVREGDDEHRASWARSVGNGSVSDDDVEHVRHGSSLSSHVSPTDVTSSSTEPFANAPRRALERPSSADHSDLEHLEPASVHLHAFALSSAGAVSLFTEESTSPNDGGEGSPRQSFTSQIGIRLDDHLRVSYSVTCYHLHCDSSMVSSGQTEYKVFPPLREPTDRRALHAAVSNTSNAIVCSGHTPVPHPLKFQAEGDFFRAVAGTCSIQHVLPASWHFARNNGHDIEDVYRWLCRNPAELLGIYGLKGILRRQAQADIVVWDPEADVEVSNYQLLSQHSQTIFDGHMLRGRVLRTYVRGQRVYESAVQSNSARNSSGSRNSVGFVEYSPPIFDHVFYEPAGRLITRDLV